MRRWVWQRRLAWSGEWVTRTTPAPALRTSRSTAAVVLSSRAEVNSSRRRTSGLRARAMARLARWASPPERENQAWVNLDGWRSQFSAMRAGASSGNLSPRRRWAR
mmetsp:Transcript_23517/g.75478  ORF Transcript_23517/g.75478 Transcript_23517/m.75478 type:complete len:106 (-) Transcript_23517:512-829(-)